MKIKLLLTSAIVALLALTSYVSYNWGHYDGAESAGIYFSAHTIYDNAATALRIARGEEEKLLEDLEVTFLQYPEVKKWVDEEPIHFNEKIDLHLVEHYIRSYYEIQGKEVPQSILKK